MSGEIEETYGERQQNENGQEAEVCPDCGEVFDSVPDLLEHVLTTDPDHGDE